MQTRILGSTDLKLSVVGLGTWAIGGGEWAFGWGDQDDDQAIAAIKRAVDVGVNWIDTAAVYGLGKSETLVGKAIAELPIGDRPLIATKCGRTNAGDGQIGKSLQRASVIAECEASLKRLQVDCIDLYQMHHLDRAAPWDEVWQAMETLVAQGKITYVGSSNFAGWTVAQANEAARSRHFLGLVSEQSLYNLTERTIELEVIPACESYGLGLLPWSPLGGGIRQHLIETGDETRARLLYIPPGEDVPQHTHQGLELTLVLAGSFADGDEEFHVGDIEVADETVDHTPVSGPNGPCICLAVTDATLVFRSWLPRMIQRFAKI